MMGAIRRLCLSLMFVCAVGCRHHDAGLSPRGLPGDGGGGNGARDAADARLDASPRPDGAPLSWEPHPGIAGPPASVGCADGTREGFTDPAAWRAIAGCAGAWTVPGLHSPWARAPQCARTAGNHGSNPMGNGCSIADLCAAGWHVCEGGDDVRGSSPTECESAAPAGFAVFFVSRAGASQYGLCSARSGVEGAADPAYDEAFTNDLHGCGSFGPSEVPLCQPFDRRMSFVDCLGTGGIWACGAADDHLAEANLVFKTGLGLGGALCCLDR
jgi:hypothetical protein